MKLDFHHREESDVFTIGHGDNRELKMRTVYSDGDVTWFYWSLLESKWLDYIDEKIITDLEAAYDEWNDAQEARSE